MELNDYHYYINLEKRVTRRNQCEKQLKSIGIQKPQRFNAIEHEIGLIGCAQSHIECLKIAKDKNWPYICIFEDDLLFTEPGKVKQMLNKYIDHDYDVLYIGAWIRKYSSINEELVRVTDGCCFHAYIVKSHYYDTLLDNFNEGLQKKIMNPDNMSYNNDVYIHKLQIKDDWLCFNPVLATQRDGYSDNFNENRNLQQIIPVIPEKRLEYVSILTPTFNRKQCLPLMIRNIMDFDYPKDKLEWIILDSFGKDGEKGERLLEDKELEYLKNKLNMNIRYTYMSKKMSIGEKRNWLSENANHKILINMDDDDLYKPEYIQHSIDTLINHKKGCVGCLSMLFVNTNNNYEISLIKCIEDYKLLHEATLCMKKSHWRKYKYKDSSKAEGFGIFGKNKNCGETMIEHCMVCVIWDKNTINKDIFTQYVIDAKLDETSLKLLKKIYDVESGTMESGTNTSISTVEIPVKLLKDIRNLIEITNLRVQWKIEELYPIGIMVKQLDDCLKSESNKVIQSVK